MNKFIEAWRAGISDMPSWEKKLLGGIWILIFTALACLVYEVLL